MLCKKRLVTLVMHVQQQVKQLFFRTCAGRYTAILNNATAQAKQGNAVFVRHGVVAGFDKSKRN